LENKSVAIDYQIHLNMYYIYILILYTIALGYTYFKN